MKGSIVVCLSKLICEKFGKDKWLSSLKMSGMDEKTIFLVTNDIDDAKIFEIIDNLCKLLNITKNQAADAFGEYWVNSYAPTIYKSYYRRFQNAKEFILGLDSVHEMVTSTIPNAHPPRFFIEKIDDNTLNVTYKSSRKMIDFYIGLAKGVGIYYKTKMDIKKISEENVEIKFV
jgi:Haem-NO-binding